MRRSFEERWGESIWILHPIRLGIAEHPGFQWSMVVAVHGRKNDKDPEMDGECFKGDVVVMETDCRHFGERENTSQDSTLRA